MRLVKNIESINDFIKLPITINSDAEFYNELSKSLDKYLKWVEVFINNSNTYLSRMDSTTKNDILKRIKYDCIAIKRSVNDYKVGKVGGASQRIHSLLDKIIEGDSNGFVLSDINNSYSTRLSASIPEVQNDRDKKNNEKILNEDLTFYRARTEYFEDPKEMYHIPLNKRDLVGTQRFSIPGVPCLYLGTSVYDIWLEMGRPAYKDFNVSAVKLNDDGKRLRVLNLAFNPYVIMGVGSVVADEKGLNIDKVTNMTVSMLRLYPIIIATSIQNKKSIGKFKSEYIISHLLMMNLQEIGCDGVSYLSKRIEGYEEYSLPQMVNIAFPVYEASKINDIYGTICEKIEITRPRNYEEFMSLDLNASDKMEKNSYYAKAFNMPMSYNPITYTVICGRCIDYGKTKFYEFENNLCGQKFYSIGEIEKVK